MRVDVSCFFLGLVVIAQVKHPIPSRTRQLSTVAPMVLRLKTWESRSPPNLVRNTNVSLDDDQYKTAALWGGFFVFGCETNLTFVNFAASGGLDSLSQVQLTTFSSRFFLPVALPGHISKWFNFHDTEDNYQWEEPVPAQALF